MAEVFQPTKKNPMKSILPMAASVVGSIYGGPAGGAAAGAVGGAVAEGLDKPPPQQVPESAAGRRMASMGQAPQQNSNVDNLSAINDARVALQSQPPDVQQQYGPMLTAAALTERRKQQALSSGQTTATGIRE